MCGLVSGSGHGSGAHPRSSNSAHGGGLLERGRGERRIHSLERDKKEETNDLCTSFTAKRREEESETHEKRHRWNPRRAEAAALYKSLLGKESSLLPFKILEPQRPPPQTGKPSHLGEGKEKNDATAWNFKIDGCKPGPGSKCLSRGRL